MKLSCNAITRASAVSAAALAVVALAGCSSDDSRPATSVSASTSGAIVTDDSTDLGSIVIGWGEQNSDGQVTTPKPEDVSARCTGAGDDLAVEIEAPRGWTVNAQHGSQILNIENADQGLPAADVDTANQFLDSLHSVDWSERGQLDIAVTADAPTEWDSPSRTGRVFVSIHVDCEEKQ